MTKFTSAKFSIGQIIYHNKFEYRGVIIDIDPVFSGTEEWYEEVAKSRPPKDKPWYHVLVDGSNTQTYVAERHLEKDKIKKPIKHPLIDSIFENYESGIYKIRKKFS